ncbi:MAG: acylphosphatase [Planctomycetes bacterium]|nr:acylphosphatase [Planctomycetota bacterium]MBL7144005.1 acylphosphatase [Phycisphaerae bacterium]
MIARHITFSGRVQGVGFRFTARRAANRRQLTGYVRNMSNGSVEMLAQGQPEEVDDCIQDIKEYFYGSIRATSIREIPLDPKYSDFQITF